MRYLLNASSLHIAKTSTKATTAAIANTWGQIPGVTDATKRMVLPPHLPDSNGTSSNITSRTKKWGQQCGVNCGCVVRFEIELDANDCVVMAEYTAKKILTTTIEIPTIPIIATANTSSIDRQQPQPQPRHMRPVLTNRTKRLQYVSCQCTTLHTLCLQSIQYFIHRPIYQLMNLHEYQGARSSHAFRDTILSSICNYHDKNSASTTNNTVHFRQNKNNNNHQLHTVVPTPPSSRRHLQNHHHCFDLVEDALTALLKGYIPPPRQSQQQPQQFVDDCNEKYLHDTNQDLFQKYNHSSIYDDYDDPQFHWNIEKTDTERSSTKNTASNNDVTTTTTTTSWQERMLHPWWPPFTSWINHMSHTNHNDDEDYDSTTTTTKKSGSQQMYRSNVSDHAKREEIQRLSSMLSYHNNDRRHWTALDWMDWFEQDREVKQQRQQNWLRLSSDSQTPESKVTTTYNDYRITDWLSYVDTLYHERTNRSHRSSDEQSA